MNKILITTVGSSCAPVVNAVQMDSYDHVFFVCSIGSTGSDVVVDGEGRPCREDRDGKKDKSIVAQTGLSEDHYTKWTLEDPDNLGICYQRFRELRGTIRQTFGRESHVVANYTGGTKTMSVALSMAALASGWELQVNRGPRIDLVKVRYGDVPVFAAMSDIYEDRYTILADQAVYRYDYGLASVLANDLLKMHLSPDTQRIWADVHAVTTGFSLWDSFDHSKALEHLVPFGRYYSNHLVALKKLSGQGKCHGYEVVSDLLNNAERRTVQGRFDDATARLYRATEMVAQVRLLRKHKLNTSKMILNDLPKNLRSIYETFVQEKGRVILGLRESFLLLDRLGDPVGNLFMERVNAVTDALKTRNESIGGHGLKPVREDHYSNMHRILSRFIINTVELAGGCLDVPQFHQSLPMLMP